MVPRESETRHALRQTPEGAVFVEIRAESFCFDPRFERQHHRFAVRPMPGTTTRFSGVTGGVTLSAFRFGLFEEPPSHSLGKPFPLFLAERPPGSAVRPLALEWLPTDFHL